MSLLLRAATSAIALVLPKKKPNDKGTAYTSTFNPSQTGSPLAKPAYQSHLDDVYTTRIASNSQDLIQALAVSDPDFSATINAYLGAADTDPYFYVRDLNGEIDRPGHELLNSILLNLTTRVDYTKPSGFLIKNSLRAVAEKLRWFGLVRGMLAGEVVVDKSLLPSEFRLVDPKTLEFTEKAPGVYFPEQIPPGASNRINLDIPSFFVTTYRQDPTTIYPTSPFTAAINTIAARQAIINTLYRIMEITGFPRMEAKVLEETLKKNAPASAQADEKAMTAWVNQRLSELSATLSSLRPEAAFVHMDSVELKIFNEKNPGASLNIKEVVDTLNAQNQAGLKTMSSIIGRGESGVNTASVEALQFARNAEQLNNPVADILSQMLTYCLRLNGSESIVTVGFENVELRPDLELEPQQTLKQQRLLQLLSFGIISDDEFHIRMFNEIRPDAVPELSGTGFMEPVVADPTAGGAAPDNKSAAGKAAGGGSSGTKATKATKSNNASRITLTLNL